MKRIISIAIITGFWIVTLHAEITEVGSCETPGQADRVSISRNYAFLSNRDSGLRIIDISNPEEPDEVGVYDPNGVSIWSVYVRDDLAYLTAFGSGFYIVDVSNPEEPEELGHCNTPDDDFDVFISGNYAYIGCDEAGLRIVNISDPENPEEIGRFNTNGNATNLTVSGNYAFVCDRGSGLRIIDVSNPEEPDEVGSYVRNDCWVLACFVRDDIAYVTDARQGLCIVNVSNPEDPEEIGRLGNLRSPRGVVIVGDYAFVSDDLAGVRVIDVSNPNNPRLVETYEPNYATQHIVIVRNFAYVADQNGDLIILDVSDYAITGPMIEISDEELDFEGVGLGLSGELPLTISNIGMENLVISNIAVEGDYFSTNFEDEITLEPEEDREITVTFSPEERGEFEGSLTITSNDEENDEIQVTLLGEGVGPVFYVHPRALDFGVVGIDESAEITISFRNQGLLDLIMSGFSNNNEAFTFDIEDEVTLEPDENYGLTVTFTPADGIVYLDTLIFTTNDPDKETVTIPMSGRGMGAVIIANPDTVRFGEVGRNRSSERVVTIRNEGEIDLEISEIFVEGRFFSIDLDSIYVIEPEGALECAVTFAPEEIGDFRATLFISSNDREREEVNIPLFGTGKGPEIVVDSDSLDFGLLRVGENTQLTLTISAVGLTDLTVTDVEVRGAPTFLSALEDEVFIELNNSFELPISFNPSNDGFLSGSLIIHSDDPENGELEISLTGCAHRGVMIDTLGTVSDLTVVNDLVYLVVQNGLVVIDVSNPEAPVIAGTYNNEEVNALSVFVDGNYAYMAAGENGFTIVDISVVDSMQFVSTYDTEGFSHDVAVRDGYAFVADGETGLRVIDLYEPESPFEVNHVDTPGEAYAVTLDGDYAYVADYVHGLRIIDISNPQLPAEIGFYDTRGMSMDVAVSGNFVYVADERYGLRIIDVTDPANPEEIGFYDTDGYAFGVSIAGDHAYVADGEGGMCMLDVSIPESPYPAKIFYTPGLALSVEIFDNYAFIADQDDILIIDVTDFLPVDEPNAQVIPNVFILQPAFPNPFNATTTISYDLPFSSEVVVGVYDLSGRSITTLVSNYQSPGKYATVWNAEGIATGIYLIRLSTPEHVIISKVALVK
ncbi:choice-of-anchor D domain-containing protein [bacterium]|nr:choice-of-anchor D domain-containing protein [bacterium]